MAYDLPPRTGSSALHVENGPTEEPRGMELPYSGRKLYQTAQVRLASEFDLHKLRRNPKTNSGSVVGMDCRIP